jgi:ligand-binding sensor domain-containing protein
MPNTFTIYNASNSYIGSNNISSVTTDHDGNIWTGSDAGIAKLTSGVFTGYLIGKVNDVACDGQNNIWAATNDGVKKYNIATNTMEYYGTENSGIGSDVVHCLTVDHNGKIWIGTDNGLYTYETSRIVKYTPANTSEVGQTIHCLSVDLNNRLWMATNNGVAVLAL